METKCSAFWAHTNIRNDNNVFPCCRYKTPVTKFNGNVVEILDLDEYKKLREDSTNGVYNPNCEKCYYEEQLGKKSLRQKFNEEYSTETVSLQFLEVGLDNICNLTCDGCWSEFSSSWAKKNNESIIVRTSHDITKLPDSVNKILFLGGEPLMSTRHVKLLKTANRSNLDVTYNTNGSFLLEQETISLLRECKHVKFILSVDGYKDLNETVRTGSNWNDTIKFIEQITNLNFELVIHTVVHLNNWHGLEDLSTFVKNLGVEWTTNILTYPRKLDIVNMSNTQQFISMIDKIDIPNKQYMIDHLKTTNLLDYQSFSQSDKIDKVQEMANIILKDIDWRKLKNRLSQQEKDPEGTYNWWYSRSSKDNKVFHESNAGWLVEDIDYEEGSGHLNIEVGSNSVIEFENFKSVLDLPGLTYAGVFFLGPNSDVVDHTDKEQYNILINVKVPNNAFLKIEGKEYYFKTNQIVMFDGDLSHSASNKSKDDWIIFVLRINKSEFNL
jgi:sulfatase maturation enzyme AslB (radical SAM superfamily)